MLLFHFKILFFQNPYEFLHFFYVIGNTVFEKRKIGYIRETVKLIFKTRTVTFFNVKKMYVDSKKTFDLLK